MQTAVSRGGPTARGSLGMRARWLTLAPMLGLALTLAACTTPQVSSDYDHAAPFASYHSFVLIVRPHPGADNALTLQRTYDAIRDELTRKGFSSVSDPARADFAVDFTIGVQDRLDINSYGWAGPGWWNQTDVRQYREGTLAIDMFDVRTRRPAWHGVAKKELSASEIAHSQAPIQEAVASVLAQFPPPG